MAVVVTESSQRAAARPRRNRRPSFRRNIARAGLILAAPALVLVGALLMVPVGQAVYYSMTDWDGFTATWIGPGTYVALFSDPDFWRVLLNNGLLLLTVPIAILVALGVAGILHQRIWGWKFLRSMIFLPTILSWVVIGIAAGRVFANTGVINNLLEAVGLGVFRSDFLGTENGALLAIAITFIWAMIGPNMIILLSGMSTIEPGVYEASALDGANRFRTFVSITVPLMSRHLQFCFVFTLIMAFTGLFSLIFIMTGGGPGYGTTTLEFFLYRQAFDVGRFGKGAMLGVVLLVILFAISVIQIRLTRKDD